jgi:tetratricopeptide (TPR) repeat protein
MGVLEFSKGNNTWAVDYLTGPESSIFGPSLFLYLGMCYENMGNMAEAEKYYTRSLVADPNDINTQSRLDNIIRQRNPEMRKGDSQERKNQTEDELDVDIPIPVNKSAYDIRLDDEGNEKK